MVILDVGEFGVSNTPGDIIKTFGLGSCVAVVMVHSASSTAGMVHVALWHSSTNRYKASELPGFFADTGIAILWQTMQKTTGSTLAKEFDVKVVGGGNVLDPHNTFTIGYRNMAAVKEELTKYGLRSSGCDVGGEISRNVTAVVSSGEVIVASPGREDWTI